MAEAAKEHPMMNTSHRELPSLPKLKEEYASLANEINSAFMWMQRELLASQTLTDLAKQGDGGDPQDPSRCISKDDLSTEEDNTSSDEVVARNGKKTRSSLKICGDDMMTIAQALEDLHCEKKRSTDPDETCMADGDVGTQPKPKKRRRRRHEIARNFKCSLTGCTKSYGSEGALKTHVRLKHAEGASRKKETTPWPMGDATAAGGLLLPKPNHMFQSFAGEQQAMSPFTQTQSTMKTQTPFPMLSVGIGSETLKLPPLPSNFSNLGIPRPAGCPELPSFRHILNPGTF